MIYHHSDCNYTLLSHSDLREPSLYSHAKLMICHQMQMINSCLRLSQVSLFINTSLALSVTQACYLCKLFTVYKISLATTVYVGEQDHTVVVSLMQQVAVQIGSGTPMFSWRPVRARWKSGCAPFAKPSDHGLMEVSIICHIIHLYYKVCYRLRRLNLHTFPYISLKHNTM